MHIKSTVYVRFISITLGVVFAVFAVINYIQIENELADSKVKEYKNYEPIIPLSKNGKNVLIFMLDGEVGGNLPIFVTERPELNEMFSGFTYFPNTISFGCCTNMAAPALFGGYEYTPVQFNRRSDETIRNKYNEAMRVIPTMFSENGYNVTLVDLPYVEESVYSDISNVSFYSLKGHYMEDDVYSLLEYSEEFIEHHFCMYSIMKVTPDVFQKLLYDDGKYLKAVSKEVSVPNLAFCENYAVLSNFSKFIDIKESGDNLTIINCEVSHELCMLNTDGYYPDKSLPDNNESGIRKRPDGTDFVLKDDDL